jgi:putative DNA primase/helicase
MALDLNSAAPAPKLPSLPDLNKLAAELSARAAEIFPALYPEGRIENGELRIASMRGGAPKKHGSAVIYLRGEHAGYGKDFGSDKPGGGPIWAIGQKTGLNGVALLMECQRLLGNERRPADANGAANGHAHAVPTTAGKNLARAAAIWRASTPIAGTLAETYLRARGLKPPLSEELRYHPHCPDGTQHGTRPALIVRWRDLAMGEPTGGIHRTLLRDDGSWHIGDASKPGPKLSLGPSQGICALGPLGDSVVIGEGIETTLAGYRLLGLGPDWTPCWGGTGAMMRLADALEAPPPNTPKNPIRRLLVLVDRGADGEAAADRLIASALAAGVETAAQPGAGTIGGHRTAYSTHRRQPATSRWQPANIARRTDPVVQCTIRRHQRGRPRRHLRRGI